MATRYQKFIGGLLGEDVEAMGEEERKKLSREGTTSAILGMLGGSGLLGGLGAYGEQRQAKRQRVAGEKIAQNIQQAQAAIAGRLGGRGVDVGEQTQLEEVIPLSGVNLQGLLATPEGAAAVEANPMLKKMVEDRMGRQVVGDSIYDRETGQFIRAPKPKTPVREIDLGNVVEVYYSDGTVETKRKGISPSAAAGRGGMPDLSKDERDRIYKARDTINSSVETIGGLQAARRLSDKAFEGPLANVRASAAAALPGAVEPVGAKETLEFDMLLQGQILPQLKIIFGGNPTEGERKILLDLQGSSKLPRSVRNSLIEDAIEKAQKRIKYNQEEVESILGGTYFRTPERGGPAMPTVPAPVESPKVDYIFRDGKLVKVK